MEMAVAIPLVLNFAYAPTAPSGSNLGNAIITFKSSPSGSVVVSGSLPVTLLTSGTAPTSTSTSTTSPPTPIPSLETNVCRLGQHVYRQYGGRGDEAKRSNRFRRPAKSLGGRAHVCMVGRYRQLSKEYDRRPESTEA